MQIEDTSLELLPILREALQVFSFHLFLLAVSTIHLEIQNIDSYCVQFQLKYKTVTSVTSLPIDTHIYNLL